MIIGIQGPPKLLNTFLKSESTIYFVYRNLWLPFRHQKYLQIVVKKMKIMSKYEILLALIQQGFKYNATTSSCPIDVPLTWKKDRSQIDSDHDYNLE